LQPELNAVQCLHTGFRDDFLHPFPLLLSPRNRLSSSVIANFLPLTNAALLSYTIL